MCSCATVSGLQLFRSEDMDIYGEMQTAFRMKTLCC